jgi:hypothetical protein
MCAEPFCTPREVSTLALEPPPGRKRTGSAPDRIQRFGELAILYDHKTVHKSARTEVRRI